MDTNTVKNTSIITFLSRFPPVSYSAVCVSQQSSRSKVQDSKRMSNILVSSASMSLNFHHINDTMQYPAKVDFESGACINTKSFIKETFTRLEREVTVPLAMQKVPLYAYTLTVQNKYGSDLSTCNWLVFPSYSLQIHIIRLNI